MIAPPCTGYDDVPVFPFSPSSSCLLTGPQNCCHNGATAGYGYVPGPVNKKNACFRAHGYFFMAIF
jgi:hypothetical protein